MKVAELNNGQTVWTEQFTNFDPATFAAVWHILGLNSGGSSKKGLVADVNEDNNVELTQDRIMLWTLGGIVHGMFDNLIWTLSICACCEAGNRFAFLAGYKKFGTGLLVFFILLIMAVTSLSVVLRGVMEEDDESADVQELKTAGVFDDTIDLRTSSKENYEFLMSYLVELGLEFMVYFPMIGSLLFSGVLFCIRLPQFRGRPYELKQEKKELDEFVAHCSNTHADAIEDEGIHVDAIEDEEIQVDPTQQEDAEHFDMEIYFEKEEGHDLGCPTQETDPVSIYGDGEEQDSEGLLVFRPMGPP